MDPEITLSAVLLQFPFSELLKFCVTLWIPAGVTREACYNFIKKFRWLGPSKMSILICEVVCERLSVMHYHIAVAKYFAQNSLSIPTQIFQECVSGVPPPRLLWELVWRLIAVSSKDTVLL